jgi:hypothetical protein
MMLRPTPTLASEPARLLDTLPCASSSARDNVIQAEI